MAIKKKAAPSRSLRFLNSTVSEITGRPVKNGFMFGVELEIEGQGVGMDGVPSKNWHRKAEGSLRGESIEYVFQSPCDYDASVERITNLFRIFKKHEVKLANSYRTSTHVHMNFLDKTMKKVINFFVLHTIFEEVLAAYCGETRLGNLFCISARDNEGIVDMLADSVQGGNIANFNEGVRYCAANMAALNQFGSIEIRTMRGADSAEEVIEWLAIMNALYRYACDEGCPAPWTVCEQLSFDGPEAYVRRVFGRYAEPLLNKWPLVRDLRQSLMDGVRLIQMFAYGLEEDWNKEYKKEAVPEANNPFRRDLGAGGIDRFLAEPKVPPGPHGNDIVKLPDGSHYLLMPRHNNAYMDRHAQGFVLRNGDNFTMRYNAIDDLWWCVETGDTLRWHVYNGRLINPGSINDDRVNAVYNEENRREEEPDEDDEGDI